ncbi:protein-tyrosine phosphatase-like protein [Mycena rebaudengoi]|nr:protein-tyrosine phosphatase-like protein [Mycena rebaudengoi]
MSESSTFRSIPPDEIEAMATPMHLILPPMPAQFDTAVAASGALYLGSLAAVLEYSVLREHRITHVIQVLEEPWTPPVEESGFVCYRIAIEDIASASISPHLTDACDYIRKALLMDGNVLVHCHQGVSRSASIVIAYLIRERHMSYDAAFDLVKTKRCCVRPNPGFVQALREWETDCVHLPLSINA